MPASPSDDAVDLWLTDRIACFRDLGFLQRFSHLQTSELLQHPLFASLRAGLRANPQMLLKDYAEFFVLNRDCDRLFSFDLETDDHERDALYVGIVQDLCRISRGRLEASDISETWRESGHDCYDVTIVFQCYGTKHEVAEKHIGDWAGVGSLLNKLNQLMIPTGFHFWHVWLGDQCIHVLTMTDDERTALEKNTKLRFVEASTRLAPAVLRGLTNRSS